MAWALICDIVLILSLASYCQIKGESGSVWLVAVLLPVLSVTIPDSRSAVSHVDRLLQVSLGVAVAAAARGTHEVYYDCESDLHLFFKIGPRWLACGRQ